MEKKDEIIFMVVPDYKMMEYVEQIAKGLADDPVTKLCKILVSTFTPRTFCSNINKIFFYVLFQPKAFLYLYFKYDLKKKKLRTSTRFSYWIMKNLIRLTRVLNFSNYKISY